MVPKKAVRLLSITVGVN